MHVMHMAVASLKVKVLLENYNNRMGELMTLGLIQKKRPWMALGWDSGT